MPDATPVIEATLQGCATNVGPQIGVELEVGEIASETSQAIPEGELAVLPLDAQLDEESCGTFTLSAPIIELATLGRRMIGDEEPDKERELSAEDLDACGEVLKLMGGAIGCVFSERFDGDLRLEVREWWRTSEPGDAAFAEGPHVLATTTISVPGGTAVPLTLRFPADIAERDAGVSSSVQGHVLLAGLPEGLSGAIVPILEAARISLETADPDVEEDAGKYADAGVILLSSDRDGSLDLLRRLRKANATWRTPLIFCLHEPTHDTVIRAVECGACHVLKVPISEPDLLHVLRGDEE
ncbi:MAG: hypothetical protein V3V67_11105 [Myxococcota bacterium]